MKIPYLFHPSNITLYSFISQLLNFIRITYDSNDCYMVLYLSNTFLHLLVGILLEKRPFHSHFSISLPILYFSKSIINSWIKKKIIELGNSLVVQLLRLWTSTIGGMGSIPSWGTRILHAKKKKKFVVIKCKVLKFSIICWLFLSYLQHF